MPPMTPNGVISAYNLRLVNITNDNLIINNNLSASNPHTYTLSGLCKLFNIKL